MSEVSLAKAQGPKHFHEFKLWPKSGTTYLHRLFDNVDLVLVATDGTETFKSSGLFTGGIHGLAIPAVAQNKATMATKAIVWEMILDTAFPLLFGNLEEKRKLWMEHQVVQFCRDHQAKLRREGCATFFEMEGGVVADVRFDYYGQLTVDVYSFSLDVWGAEFRHLIVSLQK